MRSGPGSLTRTKTVSGEAGRVHVALAEGSTESVWASIARGYEAFGSPLVPCHEDIEAIEGAVAKHAEKTGAHPVRAIMLGVTPGLALMNWPRGARILGVEMSQAVIDALWPGDIPGVRKAICASWFSLSAEREKYHVVVGDGSLSTCRFPGKVRGLVHAIRKLLVEDGMLAFRSYVRPHIQETVDAVFDDLLGNKGLTVDGFKMRL
jgi:hypothetical protein